MDHPKTATNQDPVYRIRNVEGAWEVLDRFEHAVSGPARTQADAVAHAKELARGDGIAQIIVYDTSGRVVSEFFYQRAERPSLAYDDSSPTMAATHAATGGERGRDPRGKGG